MIDDFHLLNVGRTAHNLRPGLIQGQQGQHGLVDLGTIHHAATGKTNCNSWHG
jgi:hypothetical protein